MRGFLHFAPVACGPIIGFERIWPSVLLEGRQVLVF